MNQRDNNGFHLKDEDMMVNDEDLANELEFEKMCAAGDCSTMPAKQKMQIKVCSIFQNDHIVSLILQIANLFYRFIMMTLSILTPVM